MNNVYPVSKEFINQLKSIRRESYDSYHAIKILNNRFYWKQYSLIANVAINSPELFKDMYDDKVTFDIFPR